MNNRFTTVVVLFFLSLFVSKLYAEKFFVCVSIPPQKELVSRIAGDEVEVFVLLPAGKSPETFVPTPGDLAKIAKARVLVTIGVPFEETLLPSLTSIGRNLVHVNTAKKIDRKPIERHTTSRQISDHPDPHIWLSPALLKKQAALIASSLADIAPDRAELYSHNLALFNEELEALKEEIESMLAEHKGKSFYVFHPSFGYFADEFGLVQIPIETGGKTPNPKDLAILTKAAKRDMIKTVFVQPQFDPRAAGIIADATGADLEVLDPLSEHLFKNLEDIARKIAKSFERDAQNE
ncbi:MAG: zinc ABC transporter solute-binding protein [Lentisphaerae bacterium]|nr:zinc ABC transporter solute-binding protein [Lentisphaerota bacterium]